MRYCVFTRKSSFPWKDTSRGSCIKNGTGATRLDSACHISIHASKIFFAIIKRVPFVPGNVRALRTRTTNRWTSSTFCCHLKGPTLITTSGPPCTTFTINTTQILELSLLKIIPLQGSHKDFVTRWSRCSCTITIGITT